MLSISATRAWICLPPAGPAPTTRLPWLCREPTRARWGLDHFSRQLAPEAHAGLILDQAGWHDERALCVPENVTLLPLPSASPAASPALNPVERIWLYLRERYRSHRVLDDYEASLTATCRAWKRLLKEKGRLATLTAYPYLIASGIP